MKRLNSKFKYLIIGIVAIAYVVISYNLKVVHGFNQDQETVASTKDVILASFLVLIVILKDLSKKFINILDIYKDTHTRTYN